MKNQSSLCTNALSDKFRCQVFQAITQPSTATQLSQKLGESLDRCSNALLGLQSHKLVRCLNPNATRNRLFWLTRLGKKYQRQLYGGEHVLHDAPDIDWELYASICFSHRSEVIRSLTFAMQPATLRRRVAFRTPGLRMSANNVRDVIQYLRNHGIVRPVPLKKKSRPGYELTETGQQMRRLLLQAEVQP